MVVVAVYNIIGNIFFVAIVSAPDPHLTPARKRAKRPAQLFAAAQYRGETERNGTAVFVKRNRMVLQRPIRSVPFIRSVCSVCSSVLLVTLEFAQKRVFHAKIHGSKSKKSQRETCEYRSWLRI